MKTHTYTSYSIGCGIAWAIVWSIIGTKRPEARPRVLLFFAGWLAGWTSATIARYVYPPPKRAREAPPDCRAGSMNAQRQRRITFSPNKHATPAQRASR